MGFAPSATSFALSAGASAEPADLLVARLVRLQREQEELIDAAFAKTGEIAGALVAVRTSRNISAVVGHEIFAGASATQTSITDARGHAIRTHRALERIGRRLGFDVEAFGDVNKDPVGLATDPA